MTPKEKVEDLVNKYRMILMDEDTDCGNEILCTEIAIKSTMITVKEVIEQWEYIDTYLADMNGELNPNLKYWHEVKQELKKP